MVPSYKPRHRSDLLEVPDDNSGSGGALFHREGWDQAVHLSKTAYEIWLLCNGWRSVDEICQCLAGWYGCASHALHCDVETTIKCLKDRGLIESPEIKAGVIRIRIQASGDYRGLFAIFHYIWSAHYILREDYAKQVELLDKDQNYWAMLFEPSTDLASPEVEVLDVHPRLVTKMMALYPDLIRQDYDLNVLPHHLMQWPTGRAFAKAFGDHGNRRRMHRVLSASVRPQHWIREAVDGFWETKRSQPVVIGLHLRASNHIGVIMDAEQFVDEVVGTAVNTYIDQHQIEDYQVLVATHVGDYHRYCQRRFGERMISREIGRVTDPGITFHHQDSTLFEKGRDVLIDALLLARCDVIMGIPSNVLLGALIFNPHNELNIFDYALDRHEKGVFLDPKKL
ncbi:MAG: PqqD family peptide modification chaperone [Halieaceae bacterium]|nr:PqqD family peptide modification chaperone [Halieaceae bacterium]